VGGGKGGAEGERRATSHGPMMKLAYSRKFKYMHRVDLSSEDVLITAPSLLVSFNLSLCPPYISML
jgi:hypothetical protein